MPQAKYIKRRIQLDFDITYTSSIKRIFSTFLCNGCHLENSEACPVAAATAIAPMANTISAVALDAASASGCSLGA
jgi:hypothetical protein